jgi:glutaminyl-tRNA synthetase
METPPKGFFRLYPGNEVRLRYAYYITCKSAVKDPKTGEITELHCTYDPATRGGDSPDRRKVKATIHWVSASHAIEAEARLYDYLFTKEDPTDVPDGVDWKTNLNANSLITLTACRVEPSLAKAKPGDRFQFERLGYFCVDPDSKPGLPAGALAKEGKLVFNRTVTLKDTWARMQKSTK